MHTTAERCKIQEPKRTSLPRMNSARRKLLTELRESGVWLKTRPIQHHQQEQSTRQLFFSKSASWAVRMPFALVERLVPGKKANSPILMILLSAPWKSILAATGHRMRIETVVKKVNGPAALERPSLQAVTNVPPRVRRTGRIWTSARRLSVNTGRKIPRFSAGGFP